MKHEYVDASDLIQTDMRSGNEKKLDAMLDERGANEMGAETAVVLRNIALELMAQLEQDEKTRPASDADMAVYHEISSNYNKDRSALAAQSHPRTPGGEMKPTQQEIIELARELRRIANPNESRIYQHERGKLFEAARMLERFGAGGGEQVAWPAGSAQLHISLLNMGKAMAKERSREIGDAWNQLADLLALLAKSRDTHPSPTDLRAEYLRGLEDAKKACESWANQHSSASGGCTHVDCDFMAAALDCAEAIEALKGKQ